MHRQIVVIFLSLLIININGQWWNDYDTNNSSVRWLERVQKNYEQSLERSNISLDILDVVRELQPQNIIVSNVRENLTQSLQRGIVANESECGLQYSAFLSGIRTFELWSLKMLDSSSKLSSGIFVGNLKDLGHYDECLSVKATKHQELIRGRHCMYSLSVKASIATISPTMSICLPAACDKEDVVKIVQNAIDTVTRYYDFHVTLRSVKCSPVDALQWEIADIIAISCLGVFIAFLFICTACEIVIATISSNKIKNNLLHNLAKFSLYNNAKRILDTSVPRGNLPSIQGLRFFSMCWVILGHEYALLPTGAVMNMADFGAWLSSWQAMYIVIAPFAVDTFFVVSGFLTSYLFFKEMTKGRKFNIIMYYFHRYIRLTPAYAALLLLTIYVFPRIGSGPLWQSNVVSQRHACSRNWWSMLLYVHNFVNTDNIWCLTHTWYLAVDMQLFWIAPLILYPLAKKPKLGLLILIIFFMASIIVPAVMSMEHEYSGALITSTSLYHLPDLLINFYMVTYNRTGPWLMGIYLGYLLSRRKRQSSTNMIYIGWIAAISAFVFAFFTYKVFQQKNYEWNAPWEVFYAGFARHIWAFAICWILYASILGYAGILSKFLSLPIFMPFGRISYCVYLIHFIFQTMRIGATRTLSYFNDLTMIHMFFGDFVVSIFTGFMFSLMFESPFLVLEKILFLKSRRDEKSEMKDVIQNTEPTRGIDNSGYNLDKDDQTDNKNCWT